MKGCIFCKIAGGEIKAKIAYKDAHVIAFEDIKPQAPVHIIIIPRLHIARVCDIGKNEIDTVNRLFLAAIEIARQKNIESSGYRLVINCDKDACQEVFHLHLHLLGGRRFTWPPG